MGSIRNFLERRLLSEHIAADGPRVFAHACRLGAKASFRSGSARLTAILAGLRTLIQSECGPERLWRSLIPILASRPLHRLDRSARQPTGDLFLSLAFLLHLADVLASSRLL
jgi:hypothetical protein